jgi:hypothetical protein
MALGRLIRSEPDKYTPRRIANYQINRDSRRIANDPKTAGPVLFVKNMQFSAILLTSF